MTPSTLKTELVNLLGGLLGTFRTPNNKTYPAIWITPPLVDASYEVTGLQCLIYKEPEQKIQELTSSKLKKRWWNIELVQNDPTQSLRPAIEAIENYFPVIVVRHKEQTRTEYEIARISIYDPIFGAASLGVPSPEPITPPTPEGQLVSGFNKVSFAYGDASPSRLFTLPAGKTVFTVIVVIQQRFNGTGATLKVGDAVDDDRLMATNQNDPTVIAEYETNPGYTYSTPTDLLLTINPGSGATNGSGYVLIEI